MGGAVMGAAMPEPPEATWRHIRPATTKDHPAFAAMRGRCRELALPYRFSTDVSTHDRAAIRALKPFQRFAWFLYRDGSVLTQKCQHLRSAYETIEHGVLFVWDGKVLRQSTLEDALSVLAKDMCPHCGTLGPYLRQGPGWPQCPTCTRAT